jgi:hypothetical protein
MEAEVVNTNAEKMRERFASLSDDALLDLNRADFVADAQLCYDEELAERGLLAAGETGGVSGQGSQPDWLEDAACVCTFSASSSGYAAPDAGKACDALRDAGIACYILEQKVDDPKSARSPSLEYQVMVPAGLNLKATSILDQKIFNPEVEADWRTHLEALSDEDFHAIDPDVICAGFLDRAARLRHAYDDEHARRHPPDE